MTTNYTKYQDDISNATKLIYQGKEYTVVNIEAQEEGIFISVEEQIIQIDNMENFIQIR